MMGMTQAVVRDGNVPTSAHLFYFSNFDICHDELGPRTSRTVYLYFVLRRVLELGPVRVLHLCLPLPVLSPQSFPMAPERQLRGEVGFGEASGLSSVKGKPVKRQTHQATRAQL